MVAFANGAGGVTTTTVPDLIDYERVVLQWSDRAGFEVHAREFGAGYGDAGHVWSGAERQLDAVLDGVTGMVSQLGDADTFNPHLVEVYTFPKAAAQQSGTIQLSIESEVSQDNCGRDIEAQVMRLAEGGALKTRDIVFSMPDCDTAGDFLVLNNLLDDIVLVTQ